MGSESSTCLHKRRDESLNPILFETDKSGYCNWISLLISTGRVIEDILEGNFTGDDIEAAVSIIQRFPSRIQHATGPGFGLQGKIGAVMGLHDILRQRPKFLLNISMKAMEE